MTDPSRINDPAVRALSRQLVDMQRRLDRIEKGSRATQLGRSSIDDGYLLFTDGNGTVRGRAGKQVDGKFGWGAVNGDPPPRPNTPELVGTTAGFNIKWNGQFAGIKPSDFTWTVAYASPGGEDFIVDDSLIVGRLFGAGVIPVTALNGQPIDPLMSYWVRLVSYNSSGVASEPSFTAGPVDAEPVVATELLDGIVDTLNIKDDAVTAAKVAVAQIGLEHVTFTAQDLGSIVTYAQDDAPTGTIATGSLWLDTNDGNKLRRWDGDSWELATDADIAAALAAATDAQSDAAAALLAATNAEAIADGKVTIYYQAGPPVGAGTGDFWIDEDNDKRLSRWDGDSWEPVEDERIADALTNAATAQSTADGKIVSFWQASAPTAVAVGDLWYDTDAGNRASRWNGTSWTALPAGTDAIDDDAITSSKVVAEAIQALHIAAENIFGSHIAAGTITGDKIQALSIVAGHIAANAIEAGHIEAGAVTADKLEAILVLASTIIAGDQSTWHLQLGDSETPILYWDGGENTGFAVSRDPATGQANVFLSGRVEFGNGSQLESDYIDLAEQAASGFETPMPRQTRSWVNSGATTSVPMKWVSATQKGNLLLASILVVAGSGGTAPTITAPAGWSQVATVTNGAARLSLYQTANASTSHTTDTFTTNIAAIWTNGLYEYRSMAAAALDRSATGSGTGTTAITGTTATTTQTHEMQMAIWGSRATPGVTAQQLTGSTNGFAQLLAALSFTGLGFVTCTRNTTSTGAASSSATVASSQPWLGLVATFKAQAAAGVPPTPGTGTLRMFSRSRAGYSVPHVIDNTGALYPMGRVPYCRVRLTVDVNLTANTDVYAQGDWAVLNDPFSMVAISTSGGTWSNITIPLAGMYLVTYRAVYQWSANTTSTNAVFVTLNTRSGGASIARDLRRFTNNTADESPVQAHRVVPLAANDVLYWGNWSNATCSFRGTVINIPTEITVHYLGPIA